MPICTQILKEELDSAFTKNSEVDLLTILKNNSILFYKLHLRKHGIQPIFAEVPFDNELRCDFCWLNDNSDGPEWVLVEIEKPNLKIFTQKGTPTSEANHAIEQVKSWRRHFEKNPDSKKRIFGAVAKFRYILVMGSREDWQKEQTSSWRSDFNKESNIEIRSSQIFYDALKLYTEHEEEFWSFIEHKVARPSTQLKSFWRESSYISQWRNII
ncbi:Shedu anti-phage system protein SduA domain-containing protein [Chromobacterium sp. Beijing]|uniref:Shedu anti-phage system protein SduA domain-containing protein n=1 Tax=Chromobacterium sp. Beijing TaxID=2735795 RepID=UPI001F424EEF|nr:Shedu anti-phage system protein SduA domain-containing protein [Chromobacterium sp. Beijing]UJB31352.1 DUF4263 domain-containing protein [Chromobacterium sp. Beijing]